MTVAIAARVEGGQIASVAIMASLSVIMSIIGIEFIGVEVWDCSLDQRASSLGSILTGATLRVRRVRRVRPCSQRVPLSAEDCHTSCNPKGIDSLAIEHVFV